MIRYCFFSFAIFVGASAFAADRLVVHAAEFGIGKFHRYDNQVHPYSSDNAWRPFILPPDVQMTPGQPFIRNNADGSVSVFFATLEDLVTGLIQVAKKENRPISVLNIEAHGLPGMTWFPKDQNDLNSSDCSEWLQAATGSDSGNYDEYYSPLSAQEVLDIRDMSDDPDSDYACTVGIHEWQDVVGHHPQVRGIFTSDAQVHIFSCTVGLGVRGDDFTRQLAALIFPNGGTGHIETSFNFGLGDWSIPQGMAFWDYLNDAQLEHDESIYPVDRKDAEVAQKGQIRLASFSSGQWTTSELTNVTYMLNIFESKVVGAAMTTFVRPLGHARSSIVLRVPETAVHVHQR